MNIFRRINNKLLDLLIEFQRKQMARSYSKMEIAKFRKGAKRDIIRQVNLTKEQKREIDSLYLKNYGRKIPYYWHKEYYAASGRFDSLFFPEHLYMPVFERLLNSPKYFECIGDKCISDMIAISSKGVCFPPTTYLKCSNGVIINEGGIVLDKNEAVSSLKGKDFFIKPSKNTAQGNKCYIYKSTDFNNDNITTVLDSFGKDFIVQKVVKNCEQLAILNPSSLNTIRVITYILDNRVYHCPLIIRMGRKGKIIDNACAGGIYIGVTDDGYLLEEAHDHDYKRYSIHPDTGFVFKGHKIDGIDKVIAAAHTLQAMIPYVGVINWDFTIDDDKKVILIEANTYYGSPWLSQIAHGKGAFGSNTIKILQMLKNNKNMY